MNEWGVVGVIVTLVGLLAVIIPPIMRLNSSIVKLTDAVSNVTQAFNEFKKENAGTIGDIRHTEEKMQEEINDHEKRISILEFDNRH